MLHPRSAKSLKKLPHTVRERIKEALSEFSGNPEKGDQLKPSSFWRLRIGDYGAIYEMDRSENQVVILYVGHRKNVYEDFSRFL